MEKRTFQDINTLIELFENSDWREFSIEVEEFSLHLSREAGGAGSGGRTSLGTWEQKRERVDEAAPAARESAAAKDSEPVKESEAAAKSVDDGEPDGMVVVRAPNLGLFYRSPKPGADPYVQVGDSVGEDTEVCLIEVMKLFTPVAAGVNGIVRRICVDDGALVEFDQPLFQVEPQP